MRGNDFVMRAVAAGWEPLVVEEYELLPANAQMIKGAWWAPRFGCDSMEATIDALEAGRDFLGNSEKGV